MQWVFIILLLVYVASAILCADYLIFEKDIDTSGSVFVIICPILNTYVFLKSLKKRKSFSKIVNEIKEIIDKV